MNYENFFCTKCGGVPEKYTGNQCPHCHGTWFEPSIMSQSKRMASLLVSARKYDIATNPDPVAVYEAGGSGFQVWCTPSDYPGGLWGEIIGRISTGAFSKPCAYVGAAHWVWEIGNDGSVIRAIGIDTHAYWLQSEGLVPRSQIRNRPEDIEWLRGKIEWLWDNCDATWPMPPLEVYNG